MKSPLTDETQQTFELLGKEILTILTSLQAAPSMIRHAISKLAGRNYDPEPAYDFAGARKAIFAQRGDIGRPDDMPSETFRATPFKIKLPRRLWVACYHALVWTSPAERDLRLRISEPDTLHVDVDRGYFGTDGDYRFHVGRNDLERELAALEAEWKKDTLVSSNMEKILGHWAYRKIIALGPPVVPLLLERLRYEPDHWFYALSQITGEEPKLVNGDETFEGATEAWVRWGKQKGLIS